MSVNTAKMRHNFILTLFLFLVVLSLYCASAHEDESQLELKIDERAKSTSFLLISISSAIITLAIILSFLFKNKAPKLKTILFLLILLPTIITTIYLVSATIYKNKLSETNGPVHWHADFEIWNCNDKIDLINPDGLLNRVGTSLFHEHGDNRIHIEGVVLKKSEVDLHNFFETIGGYLSNEILIVSTNAGNIEIKNNDFCNDKKGELQVFLFSITNPDPNKKSGFMYKQEKLEDFQEYVISPYQNIPPGDCLIIEFDEEKEKTDKLCESYKTAVEKGDLREG